MNKKFIMSFLLVLLVAISASAVSAADENGTVVLSEDPIVTVSDADIVQEKVNNAVAGGIVELDGREYDFTNQTVLIDNKEKITIKGNGNTTIKGHGINKGIFWVTQSEGVTFEGINFIDTNPGNNLTYKGSINGWGINFDGQGSQGGNVFNCTFKDFNQAVIAKGCNYVTVQDCNFTGGMATEIINDPTVNKERGSKLISAGGSFYLTVKNCIFDGPVLDAISIYSGSGNANITGNTFINNAYSIYFGGASTAESYIRNNKFINCGQFVLENGTVWGALPVISIQKSSDQIFIDENTFVAVNNNILVAAESSNTAHGAPSSLGNITLNGNTVELKDEDVVAGSVTFFHILSRQGDINPFAPIEVKENNFADGVKSVVVWYNDWGKENSGDVVIPQAPAPKEPIATSVAAKNVAVFAGNNGTIKLVLTDANGDVVANKEVTIVLDGVAQTVTTDLLGEAVLNFKYDVAGTHYATIAFAGDKDYTGAVKTVKVIVSKKTTTLVTAKKTFKVTAKTKKVTTTLKSGTKLLANKKVTLKVNGKTYTATTNAKGVATFSIKLTKRGTFTAYYKFAGDGAYKPITKTNKIVITR